jgi:cell wall-associated NlpC family hydrolase
VPSRPAYDREEAFKEALKQAADKPLMRMTRYARNDRIEASGDVLSSEHCSGVEAMAEDLSEVTAFFTSRAGRSADPRYDEIRPPGQSIAWQWANTDTQADIREGKTLYAPPLQKGRPISYKRERRMFNAVSFTQAERLEITGQQDRDEKVDMTFRHIVDEYRLLITFPERRFPQKLAMSVFDARGNRDAIESDYATNCLSPMPETRTAMLVIGKPLPGYRYSMRWDLPAETAAEFSAVQAGFIEEMTKRLLALRGVSTDHFASVKNALAVARSRVQSRAGQEAFHTVMYVYDRPRGGLACAATLDADPVEDNWQKYLFKPGRGIAGYAFRQLNPTGYVRRGNDEDDRYELVAGEAPENQPAAMICIPLFMGAERRRSIGVLSFSTSRPDSGLSQTAQNVAELQAIADDLAGWYETGLASALGIVSPNVFWVPRVGG